MIVALPGNESATLRTYEELTERQARRIRAALREALVEAGNLAAAGFDETKPETWATIKKDENGTSIEAYQDRCIVELVKQWTLGDLPTMETVGDLPAKTYEALALAATEAARMTSEDEGVDAKVNPLASSDGSNVSALISQVEVSNP
jgi:hypothetical protein